MIYLDIILTDEENAIEITGKKDHKWMGLKEIIKKSKISLWDLYKIKKFIETGYERLNYKEETKIQISFKSIREKVGIAWRNIVKRATRL